MPFYYNGRNYDSSNMAKRAKINSSRAMDGEGYNNINTTKKS